jgi:hypothetical protein
MGLDFDPLTGEPAAWNLPEPATVTWYQEATEYAAMKWPSLAAHSRASVAEALATVTPVLVRPDARQRPDPRELRMYQYAFNPARAAEPDSPAAQILDWARQASLLVGHLSEPTVLWTALEALTLRLDGSRAAPNTIIRKRAVLHGALGYAAETGAPAGQSAGQLRLAGTAVISSPRPRRRGQPRPGRRTAGCDRPDPAGIDRLHGQDDVLNQQIDHVLEPFSRSGPYPSVESQRLSPTAQRREMASGCTTATSADAVRHTSVASQPGPPTARKPRRCQTGTAILAVAICPAQEQY